MSMFAKYQGLSSLLPSGYQEALMQPGRNIAAGISKAGDSIADAVTKYQAVRERDAIVRGKVEAVIGSKMKQQGADSWFNQQGEETQRLLVKFQGGKETHDDLLKLGSYLDASETISQRDEAAKTQRLAYDGALLNYQRAKGVEADDEALRKSATAGLATPDTTSYQETRQPISPEQANAEIGRYYSGESDVAPSPGVDISALTKYNAESAAYAQEQPEPVRNPSYNSEMLKYQEKKLTNQTNLDRYVAALNSAAGQSDSATPEAVRPPVSGYGGYSYLGMGVAPRQQSFTETTLAGAKRAVMSEEARLAAQRGLEDTKAAIAANTEPLEQVAGQRKLSEPVAPELTTSGAEKVTSRATSTDQFGASLKSLTESGRATPKTIEALREMFGIADAKVESVNGITLVTQGGKIIQAFQNKNANDDLKALTAEENKKLEAIQSSEGDIDRIEAALKDGNSGVIVGMLQKLWPWAVDSKKVEAMRNAAVPNLARGVFGEVGVLTETDVKRYIAMIPGLNNSPKQQATLIKELRLKLAATKLNSIQSLAAGNRDVSGWVSGMTSAATPSGGGGKTYKRVNGQLIQQ